MSGIAVGAAIIAGYMPIAARSEETSKLTLVLPYNAVELAGASDSSLRPRLYLNARLTFGDTFVGFHGLDQANLASERKNSWYAGRNTLYFGNSDAALSIVTQADEKGVQDIKFGLRNYSIPQMMGFKGYIEAVANMDSVRLTAGLVKDLSDNVQIEIVPDYDSKSGLYAELQLDYALGKNWQVFARGECMDLKASKGTLLLGIKKVL